MAACFLRSPPSLSNTTFLPFPLLSRGIIIGFFASIRLAFHEGCIDLRSSSAFRCSSSTFSCSAMTCFALLPYCCSASSLRCLWPILAFCFFFFGGGNGADFNGSSSSSSSFSSSIFFFRLLLLLLLFRFFSCFAHGLSRFF